MWSPLSSIQLIRRVVSASFVFLFALVCALSIQAQMGGIDPDPGDRGSGGRSTIQGRVFFPSGRMVDHRLKVTITSVVGGEFFTYTDDSGAFSFRRLANGTYTILVDAGKEYLPGRETVVIVEPTRRGGGGSIYPVQIQLRLNAAVANKPGVVTAALAEVPKPALELYQKGMQLAQAGKVREAIENLKNAVSLYPQFVIALNEMSALYVNLGELDPAAEALRAALKFEPDNPTLRLNYGYVLLLRERFVDSERELRTAVQLKDDSATAHLYHGRVLIRLRNFNEAEKELNRAISLGGSSSTLAYRYLGALYSELGKTSKAIEMLEKYLKLSPNAKDADQVRTVIKQLQQQSRSNGE